MKYSSTKSGFTLIELMVVIVIMGILSAVAVPKFFGQIAKAKASELCPSAGSYIHLQDTFNTEHADSIGSWKAIGYSMQSNVNFKYTEAGVEGGINPAKIFSTDEGEAAAWKAENIVALGDCIANSVWKIDVMKSTSSDFNLIYNIAITGGLGGDCAILASNFASLDSRNKVVGTP